MAMTRLRIDLAYDGGGPGLEYILNKFIPRLKESGGITENEIRTIFVENPKKVYGCF